VVEGHGCDFVAVLNLGVFSVLGCFDADEVVIFKVFDGIGDPPDMLFDRGDHVRQHGRATPAGDHEHVGKADRGDTEVGLRPAFHFSLSDTPCLPAMSSATGGR
jgi:hypothetical protein